MLIYLDMCCLKRPFDDQSQPRIRLETEAVLGLLAMEGDDVQFVRSTALALENRLNPVRERAVRVEQWLTAVPLWRPNEPQTFQDRIGELMALGWKSFDALHVAGAEAAGANVFASTDDRLIAIATRHGDKIRTRVLPILACAGELSI
ncbi:MAG TPA: hypothetical protein VGN72_10960 [Tepidisphaeraceae bacterium]|jgi:DNA-binding IclR family transcriptional regulator|nr:hypothetical protein [Tepidisphaeraceae bacterium]